MPETSPRIGAECTGQGKLVSCRAPPGSRGGNATAPTREISSGRKTSPRKLSPRNYSVSQAEPHNAPIDFPLGGVKVTRVFAVRVHYGQFQVVPTRSNGPGRWCGALPPCLFGTRSARRNAVAQVGASVARPDTLSAWRSSMLRLPPTCAGCDPRYYALPAAGSPGPPARS